MNTSSLVEEADYCNAIAQLQTGPFESKGLSMSNPMATRNKKSHPTCVGWL
ncbi:MAG: hypothetical protein J0I65_00945 [Variovorax sp.]|nr:hypothetical protein [Variovorax sp.]|tara:strand:- start:1317 stop:1469 length:153 start_codon:yes stop_codon:yes gene_type:complete